MSARESAADGATQQVPRGTDQTAVSGRTRGASESIKCGGCDATCPTPRFWRGLFSGLALSTAVWILIGLLVWVVIA